MYPEYAANPSKWLDTSGGRSSVAAATLRLAESSSLLRGSDWCPGLGSQVAEPAEMLSWPDGFQGSGMAPAHEADVSAMPEPRLEKMATAMQREEVAYIGLHSAQYKDEKGDNVIAKDRSMPQPRMRSGPSSWRVAMQVR